MKPSRQPLIDEIIEPGEEIFNGILRALQPLSEEDCGYILALQKYHEMAYLQGMDIPRYRATREPAYQVSA